MTSLGAYLDRVCDGLRVNPAEADDIREELHAHLEEMIEERTSKGMGRSRAMEQALEQFGDAGRLHTSLECVHHGDPWWVWRLRAMVLGALLGAILSLLLPLGGHVEFIAGLLRTPAGWDPAQIQLAANGLVAGGLIGLLSGARGIFVGWVAGSLIWMAEYVAFFVASAASGAGLPDGGLGLFNSVLLSPLLGGIFGGLVGGLSSAILNATSRLRPEIR